MPMKRVALVGLRIVGALVALIALAIGMTLVVLRTDWGGERLRRQVVKRVNQQIQGHLDIGRLAFGGDRITVWGVSLRDPDGGEAARVARTQVAFSITRLLHKEVRVNAVTIEAPHLGLISDPRGMNLTRAIAPRKKAPPSPPPRPKTKEEGWVVRLDRLALTDGDITMASAGGAGAPEVKVHLAGLRTDVHARYATGNGSLDLTLRQEGQSLLAPVGPLRLSADAMVRGDVYRFGADGELLGGTIKARGNVDGAHLENAEALIAVAIPAVGLGGFGWGPLRIDGEAHPGSVPKIDLSLVIPGVALTGKGGGEPGQNNFTFVARLALLDLALTAKAAHAFTGGKLAPLAGRGQLDLGFGGPMKGAPASWSGHTKGQLERVSFAENVIEGLTMEGRAAHLSSQPGEADLNVAIAAVRAGTTALRAITLDVKARERELSTQLAIALPRPVRLTLAARMDEDQQGLALERMTLTYPEGSWATDGVARLAFGGDRLSLTNFRLLSRGQTVAIDGAKTGDEVDAHLAMHDVRLALLPTFLVDPALHLAGLLDADVKADGAVDNPHVVARVRLQDGRYRGFSRIGAAVHATVADQQVDATLDVDAPFVAVNATLKVPVDPLAPGAPLDLRLEVTRLKVAEALREAAIDAQADGRVAAQLRVTGSADNPHVDLTVNGKDLTVNRPATAATMKKSALKSTPSPAPAAATEAVAADLGHVHLHVAYADRNAHAAVDFASAHGGTLNVDAAAHVDLSYPRATQGMVVKKIPVRGKVVARNLNVAWLAQFNERVESLGGEVNADAKLAGTVGDPQFIGDVRWKNGKVVATAPEAPLTHR